MRLEGKTKKQLRAMLRTRDRKLSGWDGEVRRVAQLFWPGGPMHRLDMERKEIRIKLKEHQP